MDSNKKFIHQLDELIALFEKLKEKATKEGILLKDDPMYKNFELLTGNYKLIKDSIPPELIEEMGEPIKQMILKMIAQLKDELGVTDDTFNEENSFDTGDITEKPNPDNNHLTETDNANSTENNKNDELAYIDKLLKKGNLSEKEINDLLDKRAKLM